MDIVTPSAVKAKIFKNILQYNCSNKPLPTEIFELVEQAVKSAAEEQKANPMFQAVQFKGAVK